MAPLQPLTQLYLDTVAVCISAREMKNNVFQKEEDEEEGGSRRITTVSPSEGLTYVVDSMDIVVQAVLKLIDNKKHRTVADICFALSFHTTVTLDELYHAAAELYAGNPHPTVLREGATVRQVDGGTPNPHHEEESCNTHNSNAGYNEKGFPLSPHGLPGTSYSSDHSALNSGNTHSNSKHNSNNQTNNNTIIVQLAPLTHTPFLNFTSNNTTSLNINNGSVSSAARSGTTQNAEEPCHVKVALTSERGLLTFTKMAPHTNPHHSGIRIPTDFTLSVELPVIWEELYRTVVEALQHLSMSRLVRLFLHKSKVFFLHAREAKYSHTALFREEVLIRRDHSARKFLGKFLLNEMEKEERYRRERSRRKQPWQEGQAARQHSIQLFDPPTGQTVYEIDPEIGEGNDMYFCLYYNITHKQNTLSLQVRSQKMQEDVRVGKRMNKAHKNKDHRFLSYTQYYDSSEEETEDPGYDSLGESMPTSVSSSAGTHHYRHSPQPENHPPDEEEHSVSEESSIVHDHQQSSSTLGVDRVEAAASAAVCALSKFSNTSLYAVQEEMKLVYGDGGWADNVYIALLQIGLINNWLEETERL
ncbi:hypothetical protein ADEAN_000590400 [Angomonas deanei]|uniref:Uncharacterized protein n=1 Tax=Angomonas deanei TaxID=59799 RepID=A0A7G2CF60_9TRYP|nr:hypothetical protein ADEAN_000590400 [Angomonas deanei]